MHQQRLIATVFLILLSSKALAEADGPDFYKASNIAAGSTLNIHYSADTESTVTGIIPADSTCIRNLGCVGGLTLNEFTTLSKPEQTQRLRESPRWCKITYQGVTGWVIGRHLAEGHCEQNETSDESTLPAFDCRKASGSVEALICNEPTLAQLDRQMNAVFSAALQRYRIDNYKDPRPEQRGWIKGRNDCWKSEDVHACVLSSYRYRIAEVQIHYGQLEVAAPVYFDCIDTAVTAVFYTQTRPPAVVLTIVPEIKGIQGISQVLAYQASSGSGAKYLGRNVSFWGHQDEAQLDWYDEQKTCRKKTKNKSK
jgi:uncharacterized protein